MVAGPYIIHLIWGWPGHKWVANHATLSDLYGTDSIRAINLLHVFYGIGSFVGPWMISLLLGLGVSWKVGFVINGFLTFMLSVPGYLLRYPSSSPMIAAKKGHLFLFSDFRVLTFSLVLGLHIGQNLGVTTWLSTFFRNKLGTSPAFAATALGLYGLGVTLGRILNVYVKGTDPYKMLQIAFAGSLLALVIGDYAPWKTLAVGAFLAAGFLSSWIYPTTLGLCNFLYPQSAGTISGMLMGSSRGIGMLIPWLMDINADKSGILRAMTLLTLLSLIPLLMLFSMSNRLFATTTISRETFNQSKL